MEIDIGSQKDNINNKIIIEIKNEKDSNNDEEELFLQLKISCDGKKIEIINQSKDAKLRNLTNRECIKIYKNLFVNIDSLPNIIKDDCYNERLRQIPQNKRLEGLNIKPNIPYYELLLENIRSANILHDNIIISKVEKLIEEYEEKVKNYEDRLINQNISLCLEEFTPDYCLEILTNELEIIYKKYFVDRFDYYNLLDELQLSINIYNSDETINTSIGIVNIFKSLYEVIFKYLGIEDFYNTEYYRLITKYINIIKNEIKNINQDKSYIRDIKEIEISFRSELQELLLNTKELVYEKDLSNQLAEEIKILCSKNLDMSLIRNTDKIINELYIVMNKIKNYNIDNIYLNKQVFESLYNSDSLYKLDNNYCKLIDINLNIYDNLINILKSINNRKINNEINSSRFYQEIKILLFISYKILFILEEYNNKKDSFVKYKKVHQLIFR